MAANSNMVNITVEVPNGSGAKVAKRLTFKNLRTIPIGVIRQTRSNTQNQVWAVFEWACDAKNLEILDQLPSSEVDSLLARMQQASEVDLGESQGSSTSSKSTSSRSKRTSSVLESD